MPPFTTSFIAAAAAFSGISAIYSLFSGKSTDDDKPAPGSSGFASTTHPPYRMPPPPTSNSRSETPTRTPTSSSDHSHSHDSYYNWNHTSATYAADSLRTPSASTQSQPFNQQPPIYPRAAQVTAQMKGNLESSDHVHHHALPSSRQTLPTSATPSHISSSTQSTRSRVDQVAYLDKLQRASLSAYHAAESRQIPQTSAARTQVPRPNQSSSSHVGKTASATSDHLGPPHRSSLASFYGDEPRVTPSTPAAGAQAPHLVHSHVRKTTSTTSDHLDSWGSLASSHARESYVTPSASAARAQAPQSTTPRVEKPTYTTSDHLDSWASFALSDARESYVTPSTPAARTQAPQSTPSRVGNTTSSTSAHLKSWADLSRESRLTPSSSVHTHASYLGQQTTPRAAQDTHRTPTIADYDGNMRRFGLTPQDTEESHVVLPDAPLLSPYSYLRPTSPDNARVRVSQLNSSPKKHSRAQPSSSDSDYLGSRVPDAPMLSPYSYLRPASPDHARVRVPRLNTSPKKHSRTQSSSSDSDYPSSPTRAGRSRTPLSDQLDSELDDAVANAESNKKARELREKARRSNREMRDARDRAKSARRRGDRVAESECQQEARAHESAMKNLNRSAAKIIFRVKNQVRGRSSVQAVHAHPLPLIGANLGSRGRNGRPPRSVCSGSCRVRKRGTPICYV